MKNIKLAVESAIYHQFVDRNVVGIYMEDLSDHIDDLLNSGNYSMDDYEGTTINTLKIGDSIELTLEMTIFDSLDFVVHRFKIDGVEIDNCIRLKKETYLNMIDKFLVFVNGGWLKDIDETESNAKESEEIVKNYIKRNVQEK